MSYSRAPGGEENGPALPGPRCDRAMVVKGLGKSLLLGLFAATAAVAAFAQAPAGKDLLWAFPVASAIVNKPPAPPIKGLQSIKGSSQHYTQEQLDGLNAAVDWFPNSHVPMPTIVRDGSRDGGFACGACHQPNGTGHPESADLTGLSKAYFIKTMKEFRSGLRREPIRMTGIAKALSDQDLREAAGYYATVKPIAHLTKVVETASVPKTFIGPGRMRFVDPAGGREPIGDRIITVPEDVAKARARDPRTGFIAYVPPGSIRRGRVLAQGDGGKLPKCALCHGAGLKGMDPAPVIAGAHPIYLVRELYDFKTGARNGPDAQLMKPIVSALSDKDIIALAAYLGTLTR